MYYLTGWSLYCLDIVNLTDCLVDELIAWLVSVMVRMSAMVWLAFRSSCLVA